MTQDVQPLTWQKRTNLEEHQQFFSKINEIIANLAPTVDEAEAAIAQATQAIASANDAVAAANAASAAASAAATQAQTAASTVAGYDTRLTAAEGDIDDLQAADQTITGNVAALGTRMTAAESKNSQQDTAIGVLQTADAQNVKISRINEYAVGLTGNQDDIAGDKGFVNPIKGRLVYPLYENYSGAIPSGKYRCFARIPADKPNTMVVLDALVSANGGNYAYGRILIGNPTSTGWFCRWAIRKSAGFLAATAIQIAKETATGDLLIFALNPTYTALSIQLVYSKYSSSVGGDVRIEKVTDTTYYSLDGTDTGIESIIAGSDMS